MEIFVNNVVLSYPDLRKRGLPPKDRPTEPGRYGCQGIFEKESPAHIAIRDAIIAVAKAQWPDNWQNIIKSIDKNKKCLRDGNDNLDAKGNIREEYKDKMYVRATNGNEVPLIAPIAKKPDGTWNILPADSGKPYAGCVVNLKIDVYAMTKHGNAINATLLAVQFVKDGQAFGGAAPSADGFADVPGAAVSEGSFGGEGGPAASADDLGL